MTTAGTRVQLVAYDYRVKSLMVKALKGNTGLIYIGNIEVDSSVGDEIEPSGIRNFVADVNPITGELKPLILSNFWLDSSVNGEGVSYEFIPA